MNPALLSQLINLIGLGLVELRAISNNDTVNAEFEPELKAALAENREINPDSMAAIEATADAAHQTVQGA